MNRHKADLMRSEQVFSGIRPPVTAQVTPIWCLLLVLCGGGVVPHDAWAEDSGPSPDSVTIPLFDGNSLQHWQSLDGSPPAQGWEIVDGELHLVPRDGGPGALVTREEFENFRLDFAWTIAPQGNNGIKYRVRDYQGRILGCEYQIIDDHTFPEPLRPTQTTGALYDLYPPSTNKVVHPAGELNYGAVVVRGQTVEHWLNGERVVVAQIGDADWQARVAASKFNDVAEFALHPSGQIMLTDHHSEVWFRYVLLTPLAAPQAAAVPPGRCVAQTSHSCVAQFPSPGAGRRGILAGRRLVPRCRVGRIPRIR